MSDRPQTGGPRADTLTPTPPAALSSTFFPSSSYDFGNHGRRNGPMSAPPPETSVRSSTKHRRSG